jgi:arginyl-tRNA synthetase
MKSSVNWARAEGTVIGNKFRLPFKKQGVIPGKTCNNKKMKLKIQKLLIRAFKAGQKKGLLADGEIPPFSIESPKLDQHGDYAANLGFLLASREKKDPRGIARTLVELLKDADQDQLLLKAEVAGPGFINLFLRDAVWPGVLKEVLREGARFGFPDLGRGQRVQVEFVSANPTGPLHVGHGRGAVIGDVLARLLSAAGFQVEKEYYLNDMGNQMETLGQSVYARARQARGEDFPFPDNGYQGDYIRDIALKALRKGITLNGQTPETVSRFSEFAARDILSGIREDLQAFGVTFDHYFSEKDLVQNNLIEAAFDQLRRKGYLYDQEGALWFKSTAFGDEKDRVVRRNNGITTYFASDLAYHAHKFGRGFDRLINIWGADHHGYVPRVLAGIQGLGYPSQALKIILVQLVSLMRDGQPVAMTTRGGIYVTLREVLEEVGSDAARFIFLTRRSDSPLEFDLTLARKQSAENPVYYVQYAHARIAGIFNQLGPKAPQGVDLSAPGLNRLDLDPEKKIMRHLSRFPDLVESSVQALEPHNLTFYLSELAAAFHHYYNHHRIISPDPELTSARLYLCRAIHQVLKNALGLLGVGAPDQM